MTSSCSFTSAKLMLSLYSIPMVALNRNRTGPTIKLYGRRSTSCRRASEAASPASDGRTASWAQIDGTQKSATEQSTIRFDQQLKNWKTDRVIEGYGGLLGSSCSTTKSSRSGCG